ncbi:MAG: YaaR family protein [Firmicutes bacterium]|nr:YaaR family protein [Bacillota bacterium]
MRIADRLPNNIERQGTVAREASGAGETGPSFAVEISRVEDRYWRQDLERLLVEVDVRAERLKKQWTVQTLREYKEAVARFLKEANHRTYQVREENGWDRRGNHRVLMVVARVNKELEELAEMFLSQHKNELDLLKKLWDIRGLLVDLYS